MVTKRMSSNEAKQNWGSVISTASSDPESAVIVESHGKPKAAVISIERFHKLRDLEQKEKRAKALDYLRHLASRNRDRNVDLTEEQVEDLANRFADDFVNDLVAEEKISFESPDK